MLFYVGSSGSHFSSVFACLLCFLGFQLLCNFSLECVHALLCLLFHVEVSGIGFLKFSCESKSPLCMFLLKSVFVGLHGMLCLLFRVLF